MNEIKRQLDKKMGDTKKRAERVMVMVEHKKHQTNNKTVSKRYYVTFTAFVALLAAVIFYMNPFETKAPITSKPLPTPVEPSEKSNLNLKNFNFKDLQTKYKKFL